MVALDIAEYYIRNFPRDAVKILESARPKELKELIDGLERETCLVIFDFLLPQTTATYLASLSDEKAVEIIQSLKSSTAAQILGVIGREKRQEILTALPNEKSANIRHLLRYPDDSVGSVMHFKTLACRMDSTMRHAKRFVRRLHDVELPVMVVVDELMMPKGLISISKLLIEREREYVRDHMRNVPARFRASAPLRSVLSAPAWESEDYLPVIESDGRYVGLLSKAKLYSYSITSKGAQVRTPDFSTIALNVANLIWQPSAEALVNASSTKKETSDDG
ncbi:MAG: magnesium transporter MgtE N-terminal domain-containing protein [Gammaproteobacteria bacterium]